MGESMIRAAVAFSTNSDSALAALEIARELHGSLNGLAPDCCIVFATDEHLESISVVRDTLSSALDTPYVVGCSASGLLVAGRECEAGPALGVMAIVSDQLRTTPFLFADVGDHGATAATQLGQRMSGSRDTSDLMLVWPDPFSVRPDQLISTLDRLLPGLTLVGAAASSAQHDTSTQFCGGEVANQAVSGLRLSGDFRYVIGVTQGCAPIGKPLRVTSAHDNLLLELDGRPAYEMLKEIAPKELLADPTAAMDYLFVGLVPKSPSSDESAYLVRNIIAIDPDTGVLAITDRVREGGQIVFARRSAEAAQTDLRRMLDSLSAERTGLSYRFGLYFNCRARGASLYEKGDIDATEIQRKFPDLPLLGFFGDAEIGPIDGENRLFTYTGVLLLVGESGGERTDAR
jgi:small ligand-binding sensory domain FIST